VPSHAIAEEVAQDTWLAVIRGIDRFEQRSSLRTWIYGILANLARTRGAREQRSTPVGDLAVEPSVPADRFDRTDGTGHWVHPPAAWSAQPEERLLARETAGLVGRAIDALPVRQRQVLLLRDVHGWSAAETSAVLDLSEGNQRVLLHRARSKIRAALEDHLGGGA
jgi:RNA polymerase sigma-70 factor (ECF subfamily)